MRAEVSGPPDVAFVARMVGDATRATILGALVGGETRPSGELARLAGVRPSTASEHLGRLVDAGLVTVHPRGKQRFYRLASADVARALEALAIVSPPMPVRSLRASRTMEKLGFARSCYDHLAGRLGVAVRDAAEQRGYIAAGERGVRLTPAGAEAFAALGAAVPDGTRSRRPALRDCLDWTERRPHLAGSAAAALLTVLLEREVLVRPASGRGLALGPQADLLGRIGVTLPA